MTEQARTLTLDGISYDVAQFSEGVQQAVGIYNAIQAQLQTEQLAVIKSQAALQSLASQITTAVRKELDEKKTAAEGEDGAPAA
jgi:multidrug efflux pump subunit AcrA (membrane-fusion protein)